MLARLFPFFAPPKSSILLALATLISRRKLTKILRLCPDSLAIEEVARTLNLNPEKVLLHVARQLRLVAQPGVRSPTSDDVLRTGFTAEQLRDWQVIPLPAENLYGYSLLIADPSYVSVSEFESQGIGIYLGLGSRISSAWDNYFASPSTEEPHESSFALEFEAASVQPEVPVSELEEVMLFPDEELVPILGDLARQCQAHGATGVRILNGSHCSYEFVADDSIYSGSLDPQFLAALKSFVEPSACLAFRLSLPGMQLLFLEREPAVLESGGECSYRLFWKAEEGPPSPARILIVDDDERFAYLLATMLRNRHYDVVACRSAREALPQLLMKTLAADLILCDVHMPGMDGGGFLAALRHAGLGTPTLMLTSDDDVLLEAEMASLGAAAFLQKREDPRILLAWIENLLSQYARQHDA